MTWIDYLILISYFAAALAIGAHFQGKQTSQLSYFLGDRSVHWLPAGITMTAAATSAITFIGMPGQSFKSDWTFLQIYMVLPVACWIVIRLFLPFYRKYRVMSAYEYLELRFDSKTRLLASGLFQLILGGTTGVVIYAPAIMLSEMAGLSIFGAILVVGVVTTLYTMLGGIKGVIYTDILQAVVFMGGWVCSVLFILSALPGGLGEFWEVAAGSSKMQTFDLSLDPQVPATLWTGLIAMLFVHLALNGVNQAHVQKFLTVSTMKGSQRSIFFHAFSLLGVYVLFFFLGTLLFVFYQSQPGRLPENINPDRVFPYFIMTELPAGLRGFLIAGVFAASMSTISSSLNSLANVTVVDFWNKIRPDQTVLQGRIATLAWGAVVIGAGLLATQLGTILELVVKVNAYFYGCLLGVFLLGLLSSRAHPRGAFLGLLGSMAVVLVLAWTRPEYWIWFSAAGCLSCLLLGLSGSRILPAPIPESRSPENTWNFRHSGERDSCL